MAEQNQYQTPQSRVDSQQITEFSKPRIFGVSGRVGRVRYIAYSFGITVVWMFLLGILMVLAISVFGQDNPAVMIVLGAAYYIGIIVYQFMVSIQRVHDFNSSGWLSLIILIPFATIVLWFIPGTQGENNYGHPPSPNHAGIFITAFLVPIVLIGIITAVAIPAYNGYINAAKQAQQFEQQP